ncbi:four helix bundle protein [Capnocytophaga canimorsus]|uniref:Four helix bundle protein n=1 Tax=Capnocytophaga canimorsus TaxID=28188 RepID=A0A250G5Z1_9FLAO|nr:four helix bundle protein [Capnocytophaga canimorsus]ATA92790.1 four helix bundle protein [Capnocytophaga canimorsus]
MDLVTKIYQLTNKFPSNDIYGLTNQLRRASVSIPSNIAEGAAKDSDKEYIRFLYIALGSLMELDTQLIIAKNIGYINQSELESVQKEVEEIAKLLNGLIKYRTHLDFLFCLNFLSPKTIKAR